MKEPVLSPNDTSLKFIICWLVHFRLRTVTLLDAQQAFKAVDPNLDETTLNKYLQRGFGLKVDKLQESTKVERTILMKNLQTGSISRTGNTNPN